MSHAHRTRGFTLVELLVVIGIIALLISILLPSLNRARETANRVKCGSNMRQVGQAMLLYANENRGRFPRTIYQPNVAPNVTNQGFASQNPFLGNPCGNNNMGAAMFLLIRTQDITPEVFVCPSGNAEKDTYGNLPNTSAQKRSNFSDIKKNLSYSMANPYPSTVAVNNGYKWNSTLGAEFALMADMNPGKQNGYDVTKPKVNSSTRDMQVANSTNHQQQGENVLYGDGHVDFVQNPFCGTKRDNIYTQSGSTDGSNPTSMIYKDGPKWEGDSVLLPCL
jgi:prepilin-type N-terminal cleavage/methylation domain-containing protein